MTARVLVVDDILSNVKLLEAKLTVPHFYLSAEATVVRNYLDWMLNLPWGKKSKVKRDLVLRQLVGNLANTGFTSSAMRERMEKLLGERREIQTVVMPAQDYAGAVSVADAEIKKYYDANTAEFKVPEQVKVDWQFEITTSLCE